VLSSPLAWPVGDLPLEFPGDLESAGQAGGITVGERDFSRAGHDLAAGLVLKAGLIPGQVRLPALIQAIITLCASQAANATTIAQAMAWS